MKKILLLTTGGTIASVPGEDGLVPEAAPPALTRVIQEFSRHYEIQSRNILNLFFNICHIFRCRFCRMYPHLNRIIFCGKSERIPSHGMNNIISLQ